MACEINQERLTLGRFSRFRLLSANLDIPSHYVFRFLESVWKTGTRKSYQFIPIFAPANGSRGSCTVSFPSSLSLCLFLVRLLAVALLSRQERKTTVGESRLAL